MAPHEHEGIAGFRIRERDAGVRRCADRDGNSRNDLERHALLVQEQRFLRAAVEHERIAPLQAGDDVAVARLVGDEHRERVLRERPFGRRARGDAFGVGPGPSERRLGGAVVDHHVSLRQQASPANGHEPGVARAGADDVDTAGVGRHRRLEGPKYPVLVRAIVSGRLTRTFTCLHAPSRLVFFGL